VAAFFARFSLQRLAGLVRTFGVFLARRTHLLSPTSWPCLESSSRERREPEPLRAFQEMPAGHTIASVLTSTPGDGKVPSSVKSGAEEAPSNPRAVQPGAWGPTEGRITGRGPRGQENGAGFRANAGPLDILGPPHRPRASVSMEA
jgi:hypothetical protein